jgi:hypothetical protein
MPKNEDRQPTVAQLSVSGAIVLVAAGAHAGLSGPWLLALLAGYVVLLAAFVFIVYWLVPVLSADADRRTGGRDADDDPG